jgi:uncharacterized MAPEG superfamily protein
MTIPLWCLIVFVLWTAALVVALSLARLRHLAAGGSHRDFGVPDDRRLIWRLFRAHLNCLENLPLFASVVLIGTVRGVVGSRFDALAVVYLTARLLQSAVHVLGGRGNIRLAFLLVQIACLVGLAALAAGPG